jgi:L-asparaginase
MKIKQVPNGKLYSPSQHDIVRPGAKKAGGKNGRPEPATIRKKRVLVIYVGGTLGMVPDPEQQNALSPKRGYLSRQMMILTDLQHADAPSFDVLEYDALLDSSDTGIAEYAQIAGDVGRYYFDYDGFVVAHGTDTLHYTAAALSFMLKNLAKPVIMTASMIPLEEVYNDARRNLIMSLLFAANTDICEVCICINDVLLRGNRAVKMTDAMWAFASPNYPPLARVSAGALHLQRRLLLRQPRGGLQVRAGMSDRVLCLTVMPGNTLQVAKSLFDARAKDAASQQYPVRVLVLRVAELRMFSHSLKQVVELARDANCLVVMCAAADHGGFGRLFSEALRKLPLLDHMAILRDMTAEAATVKAMYLLGQGDRSLQELRTLMMEDLRGEVTTAADKGLQAHADSSTPPRNQSKL